MILTLDQKMALSVFVRKGFVEMHSRWHWACSRPVPQIPSSALCHISQRSEFAAVKILFPFVVSEYKKTDEGANGRILLKTLNPKAIAVLDCSGGVSISSNGRVHQARQLRG